MCIPSSPVKVLALMKPNGSLQVLMSSSRGPIRAGVVFANLSISRCHRIVEAAVRGVDLGRETWGRNKFGIMLMYDTCGEFLKV